MSKKIAQTQDQPLQLSLFQSFYGADSESERLSNIIDIWDATPKYFVSRKEMATMRNNGLLSSIERSFEFRDKTFHVRISPALISTKNGDVAYYPSSREELVEDALRKIAAQQNCGFIHGNGEFGVRFSLYQLRKELAERKHGITYPNLVESLLILAGCSIEITPDKDKAICKSPVIASLGAVSKDKLQTDGNSRWSAYFNPLVTNSIMSVSYRQYDYENVMGYRSQVARWLHKRLANNYTNASVVHPYNILLSTVRRSSHLINRSRIRDQVEAMNEAIQELLDSPRKPLTRVESETIRGEKKNAIKDVKYILHPSRDFVSFVKASNKRQLDSKQALLNGSFTDLVGIGQIS